MAFNPTKTCTSHTNYWHFLSCFFSITFQSVKNFTLKTRADKADFLRVPNPYSNKTIFLPVSFQIGLYVPFPYSNVSFPVLIFSKNIQSRPSKTVLSTLFIQVNKSSNYLQSRSAKKLLKLSYYKK